MLTYSTHLTDEEIEEQQDYGVPIPRSYNL